jgi:putative N6-adenine-specific DNA methylase
MSYTFPTSQIKLLAKCPSGLETTLASELSDLGASNIEILYRAVSFEGDKRLMYAANYQCRTALRILLPIKQFNILTEEDFYKSIKSVKWEDYFSSGETFAINSTLINSIFTHSQYVSQRAKDAIADRFREKTGVRPSVDTDNPDFRINIHMNDNEVNLSFDSSGDSLYKRGYHIANAEAPISEVLAAGMILLSGWDRNSTFIDPMCGSGTLLIEAAMIAMNLPAGKFREEYGFMKWKDFNKELWQDVVSEAMNQQRDIDFDILGSDISPVNLRSTEANLKQAGLDKEIKLKVSPFQDIVPPEGPGVLITNPPYGERVQVDDIIELYQDLGNLLKRRFAGYQAWAISADLQALKRIGLKPMKKHILFNGQLECRYVGFDLYDGSKKASKRGQREGES